MKLVTCHQPYSKGIPFQPTATSSAYMQVGGRLS